MAGALGPMEFNLKKVLKTLLLSTAEPVSIKDIQAVITRYHEQREKDAAREAAVIGAASGELAEAVRAARDELAPSPVSGDSPAQDELNLADPERQRVIQDIIDQVPTLLTATQIREAIDGLNHDMAEAGEVTRILQGPEGFRLVIAPAFADWVRLLRNEAKPRRLSQAQLETLAVIAYRQPVTRAELEALRGVSADSALAHLQDIELILVTGRADLPGRPIQYGTTAKFLDFCGVKTLSELPASDVLTPAQINEWIARATNPAAKPTDAAMGLPDESGEPETIPAAQLELGTVETDTVPEPVESEFDAS